MKEIPNHYHKGYHDRNSNRSRNRTDCYINYHAVLDIDIYVSS